MYRGELVETNDCQSLFAAPKHDYTRALLAAEPSGEPAPLPAQPEVLISTDKLKVWFPIKKGFFKRTVDHVKAVNEISIEVKQGETLGIVGESGSGKTTLGLALLRLIGCEGGIHFDGINIAGMNQKQVKPLRRRMQVVFQDPFGSLSPRMSVSECIAEGLGVHDIGDKEARNQMIIDVMREVGLDPDTRHRYPHEFSGGQRQRICIARALILKPELIILDEPTSALDRTVQKQIVELLRELQAKHNLSYIFISHDLAVVKALSHKLLVMQHGDVMESGDAAEIFAKPKHEYTRTLLDAAFQA